MDKNFLFVSCFFKNNDEMGYYRLISSFPILFNNNFQLVSNNGIKKRDELGVIGQICIMALSKTSGLSLMP